jgi:ketol-acid reductoisomerase
MTEFVEFESSYTNLDLATRDQYLQKIQEQILAKRQMLLNKQKILKQTMKQNDFLREVHDDYSKYYDYIVKQKEAQIYSMDMIKQYLNDIIVSGKFTKEDIEKAKHDQKSILREISHVKKNLDEVINETGVNRNLQR